MPSGVCCFACFCLALDPNDQEAVVPRHDHRKRTLCFDDSPLLGSASSFSPVITPLHRSAPSWLCCGAACVRGRYPPAQALHSPSVVSGQFQRAGDPFHTARQSINDVGHRSWPIAPFVSMSSSSGSSFWSRANIFIAVTLALGAAYWPAAFIIGGIATHSRAADKVAATPTATETPVPAAATAAPAASPAPESPSAAPTAPATAGTSAGQQVYMTVCFACHQPTGMGLPNMFPPLAGSDWVTAPKPDRLIRNVLHGVTGPITINGKPFTTPAPMMPPQGAALSDQQIADVLTYVRSSWGNNASAVTPDQVKAIRDAENARTAMWTEAELLKIADK